MTTSSRFERYADARGLELMGAILDTQHLKDEVEEEELAQIDSLATEEEAVFALISMGIEQAIKVGYFMGMLDGRRDAAGLSGERFVNGENVPRSISDLEFVIGNSADTCPADEFITKNLGHIASMPIGLSIDQLREIGSKVR